MLLVLTFVLLRATFENASPKETVSTPLPLFLEAAMQMTRSCEKRFLKHNK
jgi:hypothetical protein